MGGWMKKALVVALILAAVLFLLLFFLVFNGTSSVKTGASHVTRQSAVLKHKAPAAVGGFVLRERPYKPECSTSTGRIKG